MTPADAGCSPVTLKRDYLPGDYCWPDGQLAVWRLTVRDGWIAAPRGEATDGTIHETAEAAARSVGAKLP